MKLKLGAMFMDATRLVRGGKLMEATAAIQRALGKGRAHDLGGLASRRAHSPRVIERTAQTIDAEQAFNGRATQQTPFSRAPAPAYPGRFVPAAYSDHAGIREYKTYIPAVYHGQALPLVVMLHGCKQNPDDFAAGTRMNALAEEFGVVVVYPKQALKANVSQCWNWFQAKDQRRDEGEPSLIAGITRKVIDEYGLDKHRVYVAGLSAGGAMAAVMGTTYPDLYAATGIHSGLAYAAARDVTSAFAAMRGEGASRAGRIHDTDDATHRVPTIVFHGDRDTTVHPNNGDHVIAQACPPTPERTDGKAFEPQGTVSVENGEVGGRAYTRRVYADATGEPINEHWVVHGAGHAWSGGSPDGSYCDTKGPDASREMVRFFLQHTSR